MAEYVLSRRAVLTVLRLLQTKEGDADKDSVYERTIRNVFFPRLQTSDDVSCGPQSAPVRELAHVWLIDERLVFHRPLGSDVPPSKLRGFLSDSSDPPDLVVFDPAFTVTDDPGHFGSATIVEFKRPGRNDYGPSPKGDPILQVVRHARAIRKSAIEGVDAAKKSIPHTARLYAYIIADVTDTSSERIAAYGFIPMPDQRGVLLAPRAYENHDRAYPMG